jgi:2-alkenal reductase
MSTKRKALKGLYLIPLILVLGACQALPMALAPAAGTGSVATTPQSTVAVPQSQAPINASTGALAAASSDQLSNTLAQLYKQVSPSVVAILASSTNAEGLGSGFVYDTAGDIVTNEHVVSGATQIEVDFPSGTKVFGQVVGTDPNSDLAVVKVNAPASDLKPLTFADSSAAQVGQLVVAIGNPYGLENTMTLGVISGKGRTMDSNVQSGNSSSSSYFSTGDIIQTDASINPGNSGGPLLNLEGQVVGINRAIQTSGTSLNGQPANTGIGFAVSANMAKRVVPVLISKGTYNYPYLGVSFISSISLSMQKQLGLSQAEGAYVNQVESGGPAAKAGIQGGTQLVDSQNGLYSGGDLVIAVDGQPVKEFGDLMSYLMLNKNPGDQVTLTVLRGSKQLDIKVTLGARPS